MECYQCSQLISAYIDGELEQDEHHMVKEHLAQCRSCLVTANSFLALSDNLKQGISSVPFSSALEQQIMQAVKRERARANHQLWLTALFLMLLLSPIFVLFSPIIKTLLHVGYVAISALWRTVPALLQTLLPVSPLALGIAATILTLLGIYLIRTLLRGIHYNEVFS